MVDSQKSNYYQSVYYDQTEALSSKSQQSIAFSAENSGAVPQVCPWQQITAKNDR